MRSKQGRKKHYLVPDTLDMDDEFSPSAPVSTGTIPRHGGKPPRETCDLFSDYSKWPQGRAATLALFIPVGEPRERFTGAGNQSTVTPAAGPTWLAYKTQAFVVTRAG